MSAMIAKTSPSTRLSRARALLFAALLACCAYTEVALAQAIDPHLWVPDDVVRTVAISGNTLYIGGEFNYVGPPTGSFVSIDVLHGTCRAGWPQVNGRVDCSAPDGSGGWYIAGSFISVGGVARHGLAHIRADRSLDAWNPGNATIRGAFALLVHGSSVYVSGDFDSLGGQSRRNLAELDAVTGLATAWNPDPDYPVFAILRSGSTVYVGGFFDTIGGQARSRIAAVDAVSGLATAWNPSADPTGRVYALALNGSTVIAGGSFVTLGGQSRNRIAALDATTGLATAWNPNASGSVTVLAVAGTTLYAGGRFASIGGQPRSGLAALDLTTGLPTAWNPAPSGSVSAILRDGSTVYVGGHFSNIGGQKRSNLAALYASTGVATPWDPHVSDRDYVHTLGAGGTAVFAGGSFGSLGGVSRKRLAALNTVSGEATSWDPSADSTVVELVLSGPTVYLGGLFSKVGGSNRSYVAAVDTAAGLASAWNPAPDHTVSAIAVSGSTVYLGGDFLNVGGQGRRYVAAVDAASGAVTTWNPSGTGGLSPAGVYSILPAGSSIYVGGQFSNIGGQPRLNIAALDPVTGLATAWNPGANGGVGSLKVNGSLLYAAGSFTTIGGIARNMVALLDATTGDVQSWNPAVAGYWVGDLQLSGSSVYIGGQFWQIGALSCSNFAQVDVTTGATVNWTAAPNQGVYSLAVGGSTVYAGGFFNSVGLQSGFCVAALRLDAIAPFVQVHSDVGSVLLEIGTTHRLTWTATDNLAVQSVDLLISRTGAGGPWQLIAEGAANTGTYDWFVSGPAVPGGNAYLLVRARDYAGNIGTDVSDVGFNISNPLLDAGTPGSPMELSLSAAQPNPVNGSSMLNYTVPAQGHVRLSLMDVQGREVAVLWDGVVEPGTHSLKLQAGALKTGVYFVRLSSGDLSRVRRVIVFK